MNKSAPGTKGAFGLGGVYRLYALAAIPSLIFVWIAAPETKGKTLREI
jgi:hypothetical protein